MSIEGESKSSNPLAGPEAKAAEAKAAEAEAAEEAQKSPLSNFELASAKAAKAKEAEAAAEAQKSPLSNFELASAKAKEERQKVTAKLIAAAAAAAKAKEAQAKEVKAQAAAEAKAKEAKAEAKAITKQIVNDRLANPISSLSSNNLAKKSKNAASVKGTFKRFAGIVSGKLSHRNKNTVKQRNKFVSEKRLAERRKIVSNIQEEVRKKEEEELLVRRDNLEKNIKAATEHFRIKNDPFKTEKYIITKEDNGFKIEFK